jgi:hypothetical protein
MMRHRRKGLHHQRVLAYRAYALYCPDAQPVGSLLDAFEGQRVDIDQLRVLHQVGLHQVSRVAPPAM